MNTFSPADIAEYYNSTQIHYEQWWNLRNSLSLHYGIWDQDTRSFQKALENTNLKLLKAARIKATDRVLDVGCGVGGAAFLIHEQTGARVQGISLSHKQIALAQEVALSKQLGTAVTFKVLDFNNHAFQADSFDVIWACESVCHLEDKAGFIKACFRLLKKGGRLVMSDFFISNKHQEDENQYIDKWAATWGVPHFETSAFFENKMIASGFSTLSITDYTNAIRKSAKRLYYTYLLGIIPSKLYNLTHPGVSRFAKSHYKCGLYQYKALNRNLWQYKLISAVK